MSGLLQERLGHHAQRLGITISFSHEEIPMDTAGPLALARKLITDGNNGEPFFVMNADVTADFPFKKMLQFHKVHNFCEPSTLRHYTNYVIFSRITEKKELLLLQKSKNLQNMVLLSMIVKLVSSIVSSKNHQFLFQIESTLECISSPKKCLIEFQTR